MPTTLKGILFVLAGMTLYIFGNAWLDNVQRETGRSRLAEVGMVVWTIFTILVVGVGLFMMASIFT